MNENIFPWKRIIFILFIGIGIWILIPKIIGLKETIELLRQVKYWTLLLAIAAESFFYIGSTILTRTALKMSGDSLKFVDVLKISIMDSFSVQFFPLGTMGEGVVNYYFYKAKNIRTSHIALMLIARTIIIWIIFAFIYLLGVALSPTNSEMSFNVLIAIWTIYFLGLGFFFYLIYLYSNKQKLLNQALKIVSFAGKLTKFFKISLITNERVPQLIDKIYQVTKILFSNRKIQFTSIVGALFYWFGDIFCLYFSLLSFNYTPHLATIIFTYCVSKILSTISFIPGGLGIMEASMSLLLIGFGVPASTALAGVLIFRLISFWLPMPIGFASFLSLQKNYIKMKIKDISNALY